jgi:hypothetical protein
MPPEEGGLPDDDTDMAWEDLYKGNTHLLEAIKRKLSLITL